MHNCYFMQPSSALPSTQRLKIPSSLGQKRGRGAVVPCGAWGSTHKTEVTKQRERRSQAHLLVAETIHEMIVDETDGLHKSVEDG
jgi:hypothetical protein